MPVLDQIIYPAFRLAGILVGPGFGSGTEQNADALETLNTMLDIWRTERLLVFHVQRSVQNVAAHTQSYTIGKGATWNVERPVRIEMAGLIQTTTTQPTELPLSILTPQDWASIGVKTITGSTPQKLYYEPTYLSSAQPWGTIWLYPVPDIANQIALYLWQSLAGYAAVNDPVSLPPGYLKAVQYNLAVALSMRPWLGNKPAMNPMVMREADISKQWVKSMNRPTMDFQMRCEGAALGVDHNGRWDITTNQWRSS